MVMEALTPHFKKNIVVENIKKKKEESEVTGHLSCPPPRS